MKYLTIFLLVLVLFMSHSSFSAEKKAPSQTTNKQAEIIVYSARKAHLIAPLFDVFSRETGIKVKYFTGDSGALIERLKLEGKNTQADILMTVDAGNLWYAKDQGLFSRVDSPFLNSTIPSYLKDEDNHWFGLSVRARTIVYHSGKVPKNSLSTYADLANKKWQGRLCLRSAKKVYNKSLVGSMIYNQGKAKTQQILSGWVNNLATKPQAKDSQVMHAILAGQCDVGLVNTYYYGRLLKKTPNAPLKLFWANQTTTGTHINVSGAGVLKYANHPKLARRLIEWLSSEKAQSLYASLNQEYPANQNIPPSDIVNGWGKFEHDTTPLSEVGKRQAEAVKLMQQVGYR